MRIEDILRNPLDRAHSAPASPVSQTQRRMNAANPELPRSGEAFSDYYRRAGTMPELADAVSGPRNVIANEAARLTRRAGQIGDANRGVRGGLRRQLGRAMVEAANTPSSRLLDIPMGQHLLPPDTKNPERNLDPGRSPARGYELRPDGSIGLIRWNVDLRRSLNDVIGDVETVTGAPQGYLQRLAGRESGNDVNASPGTSSAAGYFQVIDGTFAQWAANNSFLSQYQLGSMSRDELQDYRGDARVDGAIAAEIARDNFDWLRRNGVAQPTEQHLYAGHFGGPNGLAMARDQAKGQFSRRLGLEYFSEAQVNANTPVFYWPKLDANGRPLMRTVERNGRVTRMQIPDHARPRTSQEVWDYLAGRFPDRPVQFRPRADGSEASLTQ